MKTVETGSHYANRSKQTNPPVYVCCLIRLTTTALTITCELTRFLCIGSLFYNHPLIQFNV